MTDENDDVERIERTDVGASVQVKLTRGTGTRDSEEWRVKGKGEDAAEALANFVEEYQRVFGDIDEDTPLAEQLREFQPEVEEDEE